MRVKCNKQKFKQLFGKGSSYLLSWAIPATILFLVATLLNQLNKVGSNPFELKSLADYLLVILWFAIPIVSIGLWIVLRKKTEYEFIASFLIYPVIMGIISVIPLFITKPRDISAANVQATVQNTKLYFIVLYFALIVGCVITLFLSKSVLKKSNWWLFITALPYLLTSFSAIKMQNSFETLIHYSDFSFDNVSAMLRKTKMPDTRLMNPFWYKGISLIIVSFIGILGVLLGAVIWKKTRSWRR